MTALTVFQNCVNKLATGGFNFHTDNVSVMLSDVAPNASTNVVKSDITEISAGNGYSTGGVVAAHVSDGQTAGTYTLFLGNITITAAGGSIGPFRYSVLYDSTTNNLIGFGDYGADVTITNGNSFLITFDGTNGAIKITSS